MMTEFWGIRRIGDGEPSPVRLWRSWKRCGQPRDSSQREPDWLDLSIETPDKSINLVSSTLVGILKPRSDCQPKSDFVHIRMESDLNNWLCTQHISTVFIFDLCVQKHRKLECAVLFRAAVSATFKTQRGAYTSTILCFSAWLALRNDTSLFLQRQSACFLQKRLTCLRFTWRENVKKLR